MKPKSAQARFYDWQNEHFLRRQLRDVEFFHHHAQRLGGPVLELGCGTGRVTLGLVVRGHQIVGLDLDPDMLAIARANANELELSERERVRFVEGDMRDFDLGETFSLVCIPYNTLQCLHTLEDQQRCLEAVRRHLVPDGIFCMELTPFQITVPPSDWTHQVTDLLRGENAVVAMYERVRQDYARQLTHFDERYELLRTDGSREIVEDTLTLRTVYRFEMELLLEKSGLELEEVCGTYDREPYDSPRAFAMLVSARNRGPDSPTGQ